MSLLASLAASLRCRGCAGVYCDAGYLRRHQSRPGSACASAGWERVNERPSPATAAASDDSGDEEDNAQPALADDAFERDQDAAMNAPEPAPPGQDDDDEEEDGEGLPPSEPDSSDDEGDQPVAPGLAAAALLVSSLPRTCAPAARFMPRCASLSPCCDLPPRLPPSPAAVACYSPKAAAVHRPRRAGRRQVDVAESGR